MEGTHNTPLFSELRQRVQQATGDPKYSPDAEDALTFVTTTNRKAAILVSNGGGGRIELTHRFL